MTTPTTADIPLPQTAAIIGAGPAGLMAAEQIASRGYRVEVFDAMPSVARKFLLAGIGGMNITHAEDYHHFVNRYGSASRWLQPILDDLTPTQLREWIHGLGIDTFVGTSGRVFPCDMKAAPLLRAWLHRLKAQGVVFHPRHRWTGWENSQAQLPVGASQAWCFDTPDGTIQRSFDAVVLALGGGSWARLGSDGRWAPWLQQQQVDIAPLQPSNCGFDVAWSDFLKERFAGTPIKHIQLSLTDTQGKHWSRTGEFVVSEYGIEGSLVYALSAPLRERLNQASANPDTAGTTGTAGQSLLTLDWLPHSSLADIEQKLRQGKKGLSFANLLRKKLNLPAITSTLLRECCPQLDNRDIPAVARALKAMPLTPQQPRPINEAISSAGGVQASAVNPQLMLNAMPGVFVAGEMLDWEAPTGGYLLTACFATGKRAGCGLADWLATSASPNNPPRHLLPEQP
ncbi:TIGR03862 family flavoprotein [Oceanobacter sp. 5_MG-2023]|uniref:NAD(P)/FAD-dependent oxidoreductase n=1 Tax=Oceanobacter sp. 5_MG-2023 TaxID=3062645 RepID=UPI0026E1BEDB|nr:TIGR03862 family flavoprotein [Oceanobacter sp. 5_MG-2023]MDO6681563.1 TIGR03862 family flavoprotein [Oceanobacter sp. 5_MG-2023]